jgi:hypothetical protein
MGCKAYFAGNSRAIGKKNNAADHPSPADHRPQGVMQRLPRMLTDSAFTALLFIEPHAVAGAASYYIPRLMPSSLVTSMLCGTVNTIYFIAIKPIKISDKRLFGIIFVRHRLAALMHPLERSLCDQSTGHLPA